LFEKLQSLVGSSSDFDPYRSKVAEEMLCEVIVQIHMPKAPSSNLLMRGAKCKRSFSAAAADMSCFDIQVYFRIICDFMRHMVWLTRESLCMKRCTHASVRRMGLQILCPRHCLEMASCQQNLVGIWIERSDGLQWLLITYALRQ
jgi:hypothetical protein